MWSPLTPTLELKIGSAGFIEALRAEGVRAGGYRARGHAGNRRRKFQGRSRPENADSRELPPVEDGFRYAVMAHEPGPAGNVVHIADHQVLRLIRGRQTVLVAFVLKGFTESLSLLLVRKNFDSV